MSESSTNLCTTISNMIKKLCIEKDLANALQAFLSSRRIPLGKNPGLQLRDVGEDLRRIVRKVNVSTLWDDIITSVGQLQVCAGRESRCEAAVHTRYKMYSEEHTEAVLLVDVAKHIYLCQQKRVFFLTST